MFIFGVYLSLPQMLLNLTFGDLVKVLPGGGGCGGVGRAETYRDGKSWENPYRGKGTARRAAKTLAPVGARKK